MLPLSAAPRSRTSGRIRVLVVDDSFVVRELMARWIDAEPGFEVVGTASDGRQALALATDRVPDIVLLDLQMPEMDGLTALQRLLADHPGLSVVIVSTLTQRNAELSLRCLALGAVDYLPKPVAGEAAGGSFAFRSDLMAKLSGLAPRHRAARHSPGRLQAADRSLATGNKPRVVVIGASTGGPRAVIELLGGLRSVSRRLPILVLQHMPALFTAAFAGILAQETGLQVREATHGDPLHAGRINLAPGGRHLGLMAPQGVVQVRLFDGPAVHHCRPSLDILLSDAARLFGRGCLGVVLTGMGTDGTDGARAVAEAGGTILAQDQQTSTVWGMPGSVVRRGLAREVLPIGAIAGAVEKLVEGRPT